MLKQIGIDIKNKKRMFAHIRSHRFATHLLERGTDLRYVQTLLGYNSSKTTEQYTWVTKKGFDKLKSPLDDFTIWKSSVTQLKGEPR